MDGTDHTTPIEHAREQMAENARLPWWFVAAQTGALLAVLVQPPLTRLHPHAGIYAALGWPFAIALFLGRRILTRRRGAQFGRGSLARYPSTRRVGTAFLLIAVIAILAVHLLTRGHQITLAIVAAIALAAGTAAYQVWENRTVLRDIRSGRARLDKTAA